MELYGIFLIGYTEGQSLEGILTEECFQKTTLDFVGDKQWVMYSQRQKRVEIDAMRTREGTFPSGSQWTRNPFNPKDESGKKRQGPYSNHHFFHKKFQNRSIKKLQNDIFHSKSKN